MKMPPCKSTEPTPAEALSKPSVVATALGLAAPLIAVLHSPAFAAADHVNKDTGIGGPMLDPPALIAAGTAIASIGAYRLMKLRGRKTSDQ